MAGKQSLKYGVVAVVIAIAIIGAALFTYSSSGSNTSSTSLSQFSSSLSSLLSTSTSASTQSPQSSSTGSAQQTSQSTSSPGTSSTQTGVASQGGSGTLNIYLTDAPPAQQTLKSLLVNVSSVELRYEGNIATTSTTTTSSASTGSSTASTTSTSSSTTTGVTTVTAPGTAPQSVFRFVVPASVGTNVDLTSLHGQGLLLGATKAPAGNITAIVLNITGAKALFTDGTSAQLKVVADGKLMVPIHFRIQSNGSVDLTIDIMPNDIHISQGKADVLTPVIHVTTVEKGQGSTTTHTG